MRFHQKPGQFQVLLPSYLLIGVALLFAIAYLSMPENPIRWSRSLVKTTPLLCFAAVSALNGGLELLTIALLFSAAGDFSLSRAGRPAFLYGLTAFAFAHVVYTLLFIGLSGQPLWTAFADTPILALCMVAAAASTEIWLTPYAALLRGPVRVYIVLIAAMMLAALTLPPIFLMVTLGAGLFVISDLILSVRMFRFADTNKWSTPAAWAVWVFYLSGQALILFGVLFAV